MVRNRVPGRTDGGPQCANRYGLSKLVLCGKMSPLIDPQCNSQLVLGQNEACLDNRHQSLIHRCHNKERAMSKYAPSCSHGSKPIGSTAYTYDFPLPLRVKKVAHEAVLNIHLNGIDILTKLTRTQTRTRSILENAGRNLIGRLICTFKAFDQSPQKSKRCQ